ncbi:SDR family NAD(P)-dependent oxidoreductase [Microlunatus ginsengisoli]|uniref:SDR family NAD(P)-dependent oxidoreductase n=1 Tax=Microlunatus ginsengisoli TaxID=363863 RepID=UPI0031DAD8D0
MGCRCRAGPGEGGRVACVDEHRGQQRVGEVPVIEIEEWRQVFETNVTATMRGIQTCAPLIRDSGGGSIVNIGSLGE